MQALLCIFCRELFGYRRTDLPESTGLACRSDRFDVSFTFRSHRPDGWDLGKPGRNRQTAERFGDSKEIPRPTKVPGMNLEAELRMVPTSIDS